MNERERGGREEHKGHEVVVTIGNDDNDNKVREEVVVESKK